jgi:hypothetical protein
LELIYEKAERMYLAFVLRGVGILDALRVHDAKARQAGAPIAHAFLRHLIFIMPGPV